MCGNARGQLRREAMLTCPTQSQMDTAEGAQVGKRLKQGEQAVSEL